ncbi:MAG TPA: glycoside hydrolase family 3 N-terminal domain-containing protein [Verrucomicrobiae bacterium]|jgi:beta-glucosidase|nr:glycoside hydrolase family 3 N-terminal domain-containing protein [Verrucomicrobiae bacterium]
MRNILAGTLRLWIVLGAFAASAQIPGRGPEWEACVAKADALLARMTTPEKIGQMVLFTSTQILTGAATNASPLEVEIRAARCGNVFNAYTAAYVRRLQQIAVQETRLKIPLLIGFDVIHGYKTTFPIPLGQAASWDLDAIEKGDRVAAIEATAGGLNWTFAPMVDIARDPRWGRIAEGAGEDTYLGCAIARAAVRGIQGTNLADHSCLLACVKHYAAYGAPEAGRDYNVVEMSDRTLREFYLPPYRAALDAGALSFMSSFNELNGIPATANRFLLQNILRDEWHFPGFVVSDYTAVNELINHGIAATAYDAGRAALNAGLDMDMEGSIYHDHLAAMLQKGDIQMAQIDDAVRRILAVKYALGLFDDPYRGVSEEREAAFDNYPQAHLDAAYDLARKSFVLLKNDQNLLPLKPGLKIAVLGPLANSPRDLLGSWNGLGDAARTKPILDAITNANVGGSTTFAEGCDISTTDRSAWQGAIDAARQADVIIMVMGESADMTGEAASRSSINLPGLQTELIRAVKQIGKPVVLVLLNGRPLALEEESTLADAMLETWFPGTEGARAIADTLFGKSDPSGRLPATFPRNIGQVPIHYNHKNTGRPYHGNPKVKYESRYLDTPNSPLYPFGFGLGYTTFSYGDLKLSQASLSGNQTLTATIHVTNRGARPGEETVQMYISDPVASVTRNVEDLRGFQKISLQPGEGRDVSFQITVDDLKFYNQEMKYDWEPGEFIIRVGHDSSQLAAASVQWSKD